MIPLTLRTILHSRKIRRMLEERPVVKGEDTKKIGVITDVKEPQVFADLCQIWDIAEKNFRLVHCVSEKEAQNDESVLVLHAKEVGFKGNFRSEAIRNFAGDRYDFVVCYISDTCQAGALLAAQVNAKYKIGNAPDKFGIYDLEIHSGNVREFREEVLKYYKIFKKNN